MFSRPDIEVMGRQWIFDEHDNFVYGDAGIMRKRAYVSIDYAIVLQLKSEGAVHLSKQKLFFVRLP